MIISASVGLEDLVKDIEERTHQILKERETIGLTIPNNLKITVDWSFSFLDDYFKLEQNEEGIHINILNHIDNSHRYSTKIRKIAKYEETIKETIKNHSTITKIIDNPTELINFLSPDNNTHKIKHLTKKAQSIKKKFDAIKVPLKEAFKKSDYIRTLRHEIDHADISEGKYIRKYMKEKEQFMIEYNKELDENNEQNSEALKKINLDMIKVYPLMESIIEERAMFFNYIEPKDINSFNEFSLSNKINKDFCEIYIESEYYYMTYHLLKNLYKGKNHSKKQIIRSIDNYREGFRSISFKVSSKLTEAYKRDRTFLNEIKEAETYNDLYSMFFKHS